MRKILLATVLLGLLSSPGCSTVMAPAKERNQFERLPQSAVTPPAITDFLSPWQALEEKLDNDLQNIEQELDACLQRANCKPGI